jgi:hypothetical protein
MSDETNSEQGLISRFLSEYFSSEKPDKEEILSDDPLKIKSVDQILQETDFENPDATDPEIVQRAMAQLRESGGTDLDREEVDIEMKLDTIRDPVGVLETFEKALSEVRGPLLRNIKERRKTEERGIDTIGLESESEQRFGGLQYVIYEDEDGLILGGGSNLIRNLCHQIELEPIERELIKRAYNESIRQTGVEELIAHTLNGVVVYIPKGEVDHGSSYTPSAPTTEEERREQEEQEEMDDMEEMGSDEDDEDEDGWF